MMKLGTILAPTDLSEHSRGGLLFACSLAVEEKATLLVLHVASEFTAWEFCAEDFGFVNLGAEAWPIDRVLSEALLDLNRFLEDHLALMRHVPKLTKRVVLGPIAQQIVKVAEDEQVDLVIMSPRRHRGFRRVINAGITDAVIRLSPCPVLSVTALLPSKPWRGRLVPAPLAWPNAKVVNG